MKNTDHSFEDFQKFYSLADFDNAADVLYLAIANHVKNDMQLNPLVKPDLKTMLQNFARQHVAIPSRDAFKRAIKAAVNILRQTRDLDMRQSLN